MMRVALVATALLLVLSNVEARNKPLRTTLEALWPTTPYLLEASEYMAKERADLFWDFVALAVKSDGEVMGDEEADYKKTIDIASQLLQPSTLRLLKFSLSLRSHSPAIAMYNQMAHDLSPGCAVFVDIHGKRTCDIKSVEIIMKNAWERAGPTLLEFDHVYPGAEVSDKAATLVLYGHLGSSALRPWHEALARFARRGEARYVFRHYTKPSKEIGEEPLMLSGYGVELAVKNTEYKAKDDTKVEGGAKDKADSSADDDDELQGFIFSTLRDLHPNMTEELDGYKQHLLATGQELQPLKVWELSDLSLQVGQRVISAGPADALKTMRDISQSFPVLAPRLAKTKVDAALKQEVTNNQAVLEQHNLYPGDSALFINGLTLDLDTTDVFSLLDTLKDEGRALQGLHDIGITDKTHLQRMMELDVGGGEQKYAVDIRSDAIVWVNDLESDTPYQDWPRSVQDLLRPQYPGMLRRVARNMFHLVFIMDPTARESRDLLKMAEALFVHSAPVRVGLLLLADSNREVTGKDSASVALLSAFNYIHKADSASAALSFITDVYQSNGEELKADAIIKQFSGQHSGVDVDEVFGADSQHDNRDAVFDYWDHSGLGKAPQLLMNGVPFPASEIVSDSLDQAIVQSILTATPTLQRAVYHGEINDDTDLLEWFMDRDNVMPRLNGRVLDSTNSKWLSITSKQAGDVVNKAGEFEKLSTEDQTGALADSMPYMTRRADGMIRGVTNWVVADLGTPEGRLLMYNALKQMKHSDQVRLGFLHNSKDVLGDDVTSFLLRKAVYVAMATLDPTLAKSFVPKLLKEENVEKLMKGEIELKDFASNGMDWEAFEAAVTAQTTDFLESHKTYCQQVLKFKPTDRGVVSNGRVLGPLRPDEEFTLEDFTLLEKYTASTASDKIKGVVKLAVEAEALDRGSDLVMRASSLLLSSKSQKRRVSLGAALQTQHSAVVLPGNDAEPAFDMLAIVDPASPAAQKMAPLLMTLLKVVNADLTLVLNCKEKLSEIPINSFYQLVLDSEPNFHSGASAYFPSLPQRVLLTLNMQPPESWMVSAIRTPYDLDNIIMEEVESILAAEYQLEYQLLEGHCYEASTGQPPRGLQFTLGTRANPVQVDTIVMANLGYFQLKANPGAWMLQLRQGRSADIYHIVQSDQMTTPASGELENVTVVIDSFRTKIISMKVDKKPGQESEQLLKDSNEDSGGGIWDSISSSFSGGDKKDEDEDDTLNIFSVASGHLYERLLRIMTRGVLRHTKSKVKFWFLKNFLSPSFKDFIPHMAKKFGFDYELVQYKWPRWLHQQREKQRVIWGYKILFLDVLFPLDVKKIIFVDADQIVRADLQELHDLDLEGAPYGYTPFCSDRKEMDGFRFWKSGYWASHLAGRKYHISALYVIDLKKFRQIAAGDRLRGQYQGLSQDPNSLANLDQDLPNNMIHQVPIKSLPQEWLWCETWCSDESKPAAKTIDLCNNPLTKEPKLTAASRIAPEWDEYDAEVKALWDEVYGTTSKRAAHNPTAGGSAPTEQAKDKHGGEL